MESSEEEEDYLAHEWITPQSSVTAAYQSHTEKGIRKLCSELLELKDAVENLCGNMQSKYLAFLRLSEEAVEVEHELIALQKHVSAQGILVQDLMNGVSRELDLWKKYDNNTDTDNRDLLSDLTHLLEPTQNHKSSFLENLDALLAEHKVDQALLLLEESEKERETKELLKRKETLEEQLVSLAQQPSISIQELKKVLSGLIKLGRGNLAHQLLLNAYKARLDSRIESFLPSCSVYPETYPATLSQFVFSSISSIAKDSLSLFGDTAGYTNRVVQWAETEIETLVRLVKDNSPMSDIVSALRSACLCVQASLAHSEILERENTGLKFSKLVLVLLRPYVEEMIDLNFRRAKRKIIDMGRDNGDAVLLTNSGKMFMSVLKDFLDQLTPIAVLHFGGTALSKTLQLFDRYVELLIKTLPNTEDDPLIVGPKGNLDLEFRAETDAEQLAVIGTAYSVADELLPVAVSKFFSLRTETEGVGPGSAGSGMEYKEWRRQIQHSLDRLRDHFCRQYILTFIYSREGEARLDARMYLEGKGDDLFWDSDPLPSFPFQALFGRLQQLASVAGDVLLGKEKIQKIIMSRLTETVVMWLSDEQDFWGVFDDPSVQLQPSGLQQLILDMHFIVEIAVCGRYSSRAVHQLVSTVITRAISAFSARGIDPQSALPEDEWFVDTAKAAINKLIQGTSGSDLSEELDEHLMLDGDEELELELELEELELEEESDSDETAPTPLCHSTDDNESDNSFASANAGDMESPDYFSDPEL